MKNQTMKMDIIINYFNKFRIEYLLCGIVSWSCLFVFFKSEIEFKENLSVHSKWKLNDL